MNAPHAAPLGPSFNFAQHLIALNTGRALKTAYTDDHGTLSYGELADRVREALDQNLDGEAIKKRIQTWRPDTFRV